jgi:hypothetical protein
MSTWILRNRSKRPKTASLRVHFLFSHLRKIVHSRIPQKIYLHVAQKT